MLAVRLAFISLILILVVACAPESRLSSHGPIVGAGPSLEAVPTIASGTPLEATPTPPPAPTLEPTATPTPEEPRLIVAIDPGHGGADDSLRFALPDGGYLWEGPNTGAGRMLDSGQMLWEKDLNLEVALRTADLLRRAGYGVVLTRNGDQEVNSPPQDLNGDGKIDVADELQARVDVANTAGADVFISIHFNSHLDQTRRGTTTIYCSARDFGPDNRRLAELAHQYVREALRSVGYDAPDEGIYDDEDTDDPGRHLLVLGPASPRNPRPSAMSGVLVEPLFLSDPQEYQLAARADVLDALAEGLAGAIDAFFGEAQATGTIQ